MNRDSTLAGLVLAIAFGTAAGAERLGSEEVDARWPVADDWPVIDARTEEAASKRPVPGAIAYPPAPEWRSDSPGVVVLAPKGGRWQQVAASLEKRLPGRVVVIQGGYEGLRALRGGKITRPKVMTNPLPRGTTTPSGTCSPGEPLQTFGD